MTDVLSGEDAAGIDILLTAGAGGVSSPASRNAAGQELRVLWHRYGGDTGPP
jgi:hypothetical protein